MTGRPQRLVIAGVDAHTATHHAAVIDLNGALLGWPQFPAPPPATSHLPRSCRRSGRLIASGSREQVPMAPVWLATSRRQEWLLLKFPAPTGEPAAATASPTRSDAEAAARSVLAGTATAPPKFGTGGIEGLRALRAKRAGAVKVMTAGLNQVHALVITASAELRTRIARLTRIQLLNTCAPLRPDTDRMTGPAQATNFA